jgi:hypothetical protein
METVPEKSRFGTNRTRQFAPLSGSKRAALVLTVPKLFQCAPKPFRQDLEPACDVLQPVPRFSTRTALLSIDDGTAGKGRPTPPKGGAALDPQSDPRYDHKAVTGFNIAASPPPSSWLSPANPTDPDSPGSTEPTHEALRTAAEA